MKTKILIIEHDLAAIAAIQHALKIGHVNCITEMVQSEKEFEKALHQYKPDLILSNYTLPSFDGLTAFKIKQKRAAQTPFIFVSKSIGEENVTELIKSGVTDFVLKERLFTLTNKVNRAIKEAEITRLIRKFKQSKEIHLSLKTNTKILDSSLDVICSFDEEGRFVSVNAASIYLWGYKPEELLGKKYIDLVFHEDIEKTLKTDVTIKGGTPITAFENRYIHKNGRIVPVLWSSRWDEKDKKSYAIAKDATDKKNVEKAFEIERQRFHDLYSQAPSYMGILKGPNHVYELANNLYLQLIDKNDIIGKTVKEVLPELEAQGIFEFLDTVYQTGETFSANEMLVKFDHHGNGVLVDTYLNFIYQAHRGIDGTIDGIFFFANDVTEQVLSRKKIEDSVLHYSSLIEQVGDAICFVDVCMKIVEVNNYACEKLGYSREEIFQLSINDFFLEEDLKVNPLKIEALKAGNTVRGERRLLTKDGTLLDVEMSAKILKDGNMILFVRDISEHKKTQKAIMESKKKYRFFFENNPVPMWIIDVNNFKFLDVNEMAILQYGYSREEFLSLSAIDIRPEEDKERFRQSRNSSKINETYYNRGIWNHKKKNGTVIPVEIIAHEIIYEGVTARFILSTDITDRRKAELNLELRNKDLTDYKFALDQSSIVGITDKKGIIIYANDNLCKISQYSREELIGQDHRIIYSGCHTNAYIQNKWKTISQGKIWKGELKHKAKDGTFYWVDTTIIPFLDEQGKPYQYVATRFDITNRKNAELKLELQNKELAFQNEEKENRAADLIIANKELAFQNEEKENRAAELIIANKELAFQNEEKENRDAELINANKELIKTNIELDRFVYSVSHDLRSPLTSVLGLLSFIEEESVEPATLEHAKMIRDSINRLDEFIKNILSYSRNNRTGLDIEKVPIQQKVLAIVHTLQSLKDAKEIHFEIDIKEQQPFYTDRLRFITILENLISNAVKHHQKDISGRYIKITGQSDHEKLQLTIADNGIGIAPKYHQKIFDMFFRLSGKTDGSGIGLYIVKDTIEILQGSFEIQSEKGTGTTFIITLKNLKP